MTTSYRLGDLAERIGARARGDANIRVAGVADIGDAGPSDITWVTGPAYAAELPKSGAGAVLVDRNFGPTPMPALLCDHLDRSLAQLLDAFAPPLSQPEPGIHPTAVIHATARVGERVAIGPFVVVDQEAEIGCDTVLHAGVFVGRQAIVGRGCVIWPHVVIRDRCRLGDRVIVHPNSVIGADGFGYFFDQGRHRKFPHIGGVRIEDEVEIGACTCIDRSKVGDTVIGRGTKLDNLVQIAHNVRIGEHCVLAGHTGLSGSTRVGNYCVFGGRTGTGDHVVIGDEARLALIATATKEVPAGMTVSGFPAQEHRAELRERAAIRRLPALFEQVKELAARVKRLEASADHPS